MEEEKKKIRINLLTFLILITIVLIIIIGVANHILKNDKIAKTQLSEKNLKEDVMEIENNIKEDGDLNINQTSKNAKIETQMFLDNMKDEGVKYFIKEDKELDITDTDLDADIFFAKDGSFSAYMTFGNSISGKFEFKNNKYFCTIEECSGEYSPVQKTTGKIVFEKIDESSIKIIESSDTYMIKVTKDTNSRMGINRRRQRNEYTSFC